MARPTLNDVQLNSIDIDSYVISSKVTKLYNDSFRVCVIRCNRSLLDHASFNFKDKSAIGLSLTLKRGVSSATEQFEFKGFVEDYTLHAGSLILIGGDELKNAQKRTVTKSWDVDIDTEAGVISDIFTSLYNDYTDITASATGIQASGAVHIRKKFLCNNRNVFEAAQELADNLDWQQYYKPSVGEVFFEPKGFTQSTETLQTGVNIIGSVKWDYKSRDLVNKIKILGAEQEVETTESGQLNVTADWNTTSITLTKKPVSVKVYSDAANPPTTLKTGGDETTTGTYDYEVDPENKLLKLVSGQFTANHYAEVRYSHMLPTPVVMENTTSIDTYYLSEKTIFKSDLLNVEDVELYGRKYLDRYSAPFRSTILPVVNATDLEPGQQIRVIDGENGIDDWFMITKVEISRPYKFDRVWVGDEILKTSEFGADVDTRIKRLEEKFGKSEDILVHVIDFARDVRFERRYFKMVGRTIESGVLYWDHPTQGDWDPTGFNWGDATKLQSADGTWPETKVLIPGNNIFKEVLYDEEFNHSNTTATVVTTGTQTISFTNTEIFESELMSKGIDYNYLKVTLGSADTTLLTIQASADGKANWQTLTHDTRTEMTNVSSAGTAVKITATSTVTVANKKDVSGQITGAAIKVVHEE